MITYKLGSTGPVVKQIQKALGLIQDGIFGKLTREVLIQWQRDHGLTPDGIAGPATLAKLLPEAAARTIGLKKSRRKITDIVVHCTATKAGQDLCAADIRRMHKRQGWSDIGYHYVIRLDGKIEFGRDVDIVGAHVNGHNANSIGIVYVGGLDKDGKATDTRTDLQKAALRHLLKNMRTMYPTARISGHRDFSPDKNGDGIISPCEWIKQCPCFDAKTEYSDI